MHQMQGLAGSEVALGQSVDGLQSRMIRHAGTGEIDNDVVVVLRHCGAWQRGGNGHGQGRALNIEVEIGVVRHRLRFAALVRDHAFPPERLGLSIDFHIVWRPNAPGNALQSYSFTEYLCILLR